MYAQFRFRGGPKAGEATVVGTDFVTIGRHPTSDVVFDAERDLDVSMRHAAVFKQGGSFMVRDLGSSNGIFRNGKRVRSDQPLEPGDVLRFGPDGPEIEFSTSAAFTPARQETRSGGPVSSEIFGPRSVPQPMASPADRPARRWAWIAAVLVILSLTGAGAMHLFRSRTALSARRAELLGRTERLLIQLGETRAAAPGLRTALADAHQDLDRLRTTIAASPLRSTGLDSLGDAVADAVVHPERLLAAAALDPDRAVNTLRPAVAVIAAELPGGRAAAGTAVAVHTAGDTVWLATVRDVVYDTAGRSASRIAVIFDGSSQAFRGVMTRSDGNLALIRAVVRGHPQVTATLATQVSPGQAVGWYGYPFGLDSLADWRTSGVSGHGAVGLVVSAGTDGVVLNGLGNLLPPGSPVFLPGGQVIGLIVSAPDRTGPVAVLSASTIGAALQHGAP